MKISLSSQTIHPPNKDSIQSTDYGDGTYFLHPQPIGLQNTAPPALHSNHPNELTTTLVVVDGNLDYAQWLSAGIIEGAKPLILKPDQDGVEQISKATRAYRFIQHLHILAYAVPGCLYLGNVELNLETLPKYRLQLLTWFMARLRWASEKPEDQSSPECLYTPACTLSFYAGRLAVGESGTEFLQRLHYLTGAQIAASTQPIGNQVLGGTWELDTIISDRILYASGADHPIPSLPMAATTLAAYPSLLTSFK